MTTTKTHVPDREVQEAARRVGVAPQQRPHRPDDAARVDEIARMLGGVRITATTRQHADELLRHAREDAAAG